MHKCDFCEYSYLNAGGKPVCWLANYNQTERSPYCINAIKEMKETFKKGKEEDAR